MNICASELNFTFPGKRTSLLRDVNFTWKQGQVVVLQGKNGVGKSTLTRIICKALPDDYETGISGCLCLDCVQADHLSADQLAAHESPDEAKKAESARVNLLTIGRRQSAQYISALFPDPDLQILTPDTESELAFGLEQQGIPVNRMDDMINEIISELSLKPLRYRNPRLCSGGEKQLILFAAILLMNRPFLILDEALAMIDNSRIDKVKEMIARHKRASAGLLLIDHQGRFDDIADEVWSLKEGHLTLQSRFQVRELK